MSRRLFIVPALALLAGLTLGSPGTLAAQDLAREGIEVRGDWVIEVVNPDGSLSDRREFSNDLVNPRMLAWALASGGDAGLSRISLDQCQESDGSVFACSLEATSNWDDIADPVTAAEDGSGPASLVLEASITVVAPTVSTVTVSSVATQASACLASDATCSADQTAPEVTATTLASPVEAADGQTIVVTVTITFN